MVKGKPLLGTLMNYAHPLARGLALYQIFNESNGALTWDSSPNHNHGIMHNCQWREGGVHFNSTDAYINCGNDASLDITDAITIEAWVKRTRTGSEVLISKSHDGSFEFGIIGDILKGYIGGSVIDNIVGTTTITDTNWHHLVFTYIQSSGQAYLYLDGTVDKDEVLTATMGTFATNLKIGNRDIGGLPFNGTIDEVRIYNRALSAEEIKQSYLEPYAMFY